jgi:hypothetical protein
VSGFGRGALPCLAGVPIEEEYVKAYLRLINRSEIILLLFFVFIIGSGLWGGRLA